MPTTRPREVLPTTEARARLSQIAADFDRQGLGADPVTFGSHRRPQGVIVPWELWVALLPAIEDQLDALEVQHRLRGSDDKRVSFDDVAKQLGRDPRDYR